MTLPVLLLPCFSGSLWSNGVGSLDPLVLRCVQLLFCALFLAQDFVLIVDLLCSALGLTRS